MQNLAAKQIGCRFCVSLVLFGIVVIVAEVWRRSHTGCGIPVVLWCEVLFIFLILQEALALPILCMLNNPECIMKYIVAYMAIMITIFISWIIYGYMLYFGDDNNCQENPHTAGWLVFMIILLFVGILVIILVFIACIVLCCVCCMMKS